MCIRDRWRDEHNECHDVLQGEGGEQGDALMPALFSLGMAEALREAQSHLQANELVIAYLDDIYIVTSPERARAAYDMVTATVAARCGIMPNLGKTVCWNRANTCPPGIEALGEGVWRGTGDQAARGIRVLGAPMGSAEFVQAFGVQHVQKASGLLQQIFNLPQVQHAWLLFYFCLVPRINHLLRQVPPDLVTSTAAAFNELTASGLCELLHAVSYTHLTLPTILRV